VTRSAAARGATGSAVRRMWGPATKEKGFWLCGLLCGRVPPRPPRLTRGKLYLKMCTVAIKHDLFFGRKTCASMLIIVRICSILFIEVVRWKVRLVYFVQPALSLSLLDQDKNTGAGFESFSAWFLPSIFASSILSVFSCGCGREEMYVLTSEIVRFYQ
jgi:hypothetical protein